MYEIKCLSFFSSGIKDGYESMKQAKQRMKEWILDPTYWPLQKATLKRLTSLTNGSATDQLYVLEGELHNLPQFLVLDILQWRIQDFPCEGANFQRAYISKNLYVKNKRARTLSLRPPWIRQCFVDCIICVWTLKRHFTEFVVDPSSGGGEGGLGTQNSSFAHS